MSGNFTTGNESFLKVSTPGVMKYNGQPLRAIRKQEGNANYAIVFRFLGADDLEFEIRARQQDEDYLAVKISFADQKITLFGIGNSNLTPSEVSHTLLSGRLYSLELWMLDEKIYVKLNGSPVITAFWSENFQYHGFSLSVLALPSSGFASFFASAVHELTPFQNQPLLDSSDLLVQYRELIRQQADNPDSDWRSFIRRVETYKRHRNLGHPNDDWRTFGYPLNEPSSDEWFNA